MKFKNKKQDNRVRITFRDVRTGKIIRGVSEPLTVKGKAPSMLRLTLTAYAPCKKHVYPANHPTMANRPISTQFCGCRPKVVGSRSGPINMCIRGFGAFTRQNILNTNSASTDVKDVGNTGRTVNANTATSAIMIVAGTGTTAADAGDYKLTTTSTDYKTSGDSYTQSATVNALGTWSGTSGSFTVTATITNISGGTLAYAEVGISLTANDSGAAARQFLITHDVFTALNVSNNGTLAVTYTLTYQ